MANIAYNTVTTFNSNDSSLSTNVIALTTSKLIAVSCGNEGSRIVRLAVGNISNNEITWEATVSVANGFSNVSILKIDSSTFALLYSNSSSVYKLRICTVSGNTITQGAENTLSGASIKMDLLTSSRIIFLANERIDSYRTNLNASFGDISGSTVTQSANTLIFNTSIRWGQVSPFTPVVLTSTQFIAIHNTGTESDYKSTARVCDVSGNTITPRTAYEYMTSVSYNHWAKRLSDTTFVICANYYSTGYYVKAIIGTVSGTSISYGNFTNCYGGLNSSQAIPIPISETRFASVGFLGTGSALGNAEVGDIDGTTISFSGLSTSIDAKSNTSGACYLDSGKFVQTVTDYTAGQGYRGRVVIGTISDVVAPTVTTQSATNVAQTSCTGNGNITATGGANATRRGFCYKVGTSGDPTTSDSVAYDDGDFGTGAFTKSITGLSAGTDYRVRAYAVNSSGTSYGTTVDVTTLSAFIPRTTIF